MDSCTLACILENRLRMHEDRKKERKKERKKLEHRYEKKKIYKQIDNYRMNGFI